MNYWNCFRKKIYKIVDTDGNTPASKIYDILMLFLIVASILPLAFRDSYPIFEVFDKVAVTAFIIDYAMRWMAADYLMPNKKNWQAFVLYPVTPFAIIDILSILPSFVAFNRVFKLLRISRFLKILRVFKFIRYSKHLRILLRVMHKERNILLTVMVIALLYILITALIMFNSEESIMFVNFFDALYWATTTLTTVGYGDIYPITDIGRIISMFSAIFGVAIIALPSGVITASYLDELREEKANYQKQKNNDDTK